MSIRYIRGYHHEVSYNIQCSTTKKKKKISIKDMCSTIYKNCRNKINLVYKLQHIESFKNKSVRTTLRERLLRNKK